MRVEIAGMVNQSINGSPVHFSKFIIMTTMLAADLALNCILDYDLFNDQYRGIVAIAYQKFISSYCLLVNNNSGTRSGATPAAQLLLGLAGLQVVIQIIIFLILFISMADTFLFRVAYFIKLIILYL